MERKQGMTTDEGLTGSESVRKLQTVLHDRAKEEPDRRFHALIDKVWREDFLAEAWRQARRNGGTVGVDGESFARIESYGVGRWLGELARDLREGTYVPQAVRQVLIPKKQPGKFRPLGIPCIRDRVAQTSAMLVLAPIFEADLQAEQYAYRPGRSANDAVKRVHGLLNRGFDEVVDGDLSNYFGEIPHAELLQSVARRVSDGRMLGLIKAWLEMPVEEDDGKGCKRRTNRARRERKGTADRDREANVAAVMTATNIGRHRPGTTRRVCRPLQALHAHTVPTPHRNRQAWREATGAQGGLTRKYLRADPTAPQMAPSQPSEGPRVCRGRRSRLMLSNLYHNLCS